MVNVGVTQVLPGSFEAESHYYPRVLNAQIHPMVRSFMGLGNDRIAIRYVHLHPEADPHAVREVLGYAPKYFRWGGTDLFHATTERGSRRMVVVETNSCPSGQKSMPVFDEQVEQAGYRRLIEQSFVPLLQRRSLPSGDLAVVYDKNRIESSGYAATLADVTGSPVWLVPCPADELERYMRFEDGVLHILTPDGEWRPVRAALRYVTQRPWNRIPPLSKTLIFNPVLVCLAGGRNKLLAAKAYDILNADLAASGLKIHTPETIWDIAKEEVPLWVQRMGGSAVVKNPYSNAGQGVWTITSDRELEAFMALEQEYDRFIVQALIGNFQWSSRSTQGRYYHVGTVPNKKGQIHVADLRVMVGGSGQGFYPVAIYARRAREPLADALHEGDDSWAMLGTNLSVKQADGQWTAETQRLLLMDSRDFNRLGVGLDDFVDAYLQTVLSVMAIDKMASSLVTQKGKFRRRLFGALNPDARLLAEIAS